MANWNSAWGPFMVAIGIVSFLSGSLSRASDATVYLHCLSLRFQPATTKFFSLVYTLELTTGASSDPANGELALLADGAPTSHGGFYFYTDPTTLETIYGSLLLNIPPFMDANTNGFHDFFEVSQGVSTTTTTGTWDDGASSGALKAEWSRAANSKNGTCKLTFVDTSLTFVHTFEVIELNGTLSYASAGTNVTGRVALVQTQNVTNTLSGPVSFTKVNTNRVSLAAGSWTNATGQAMTYFSSGQIDRDRTNYFGFLDFVDGDPSTPIKDYLTWTVFISDLNDSNGNGIPDLSDIAPARAPRLALSLATNLLVLSISGRVGQVHEVQQTSLISQTNWIPILSLTLTNDPQMVLLPWPTNKMSFWRIKLP